MVIQKASINGINRRRNRVGDHMILNDTVGDNSDVDNNCSLVFQVNSIEDIEDEIDINDIGDACVFSSQSNFGNQLIQQHLKLIGTYFKYPFVVVVVTLLFPPSINLISLIIVYTVQQEITVILEKRMIQF